MTQQELTEYYEFDDEYENPWRNARWLELRMMYCTYAMLDPGIGVAVLEVTPGANNQEYWAEELQLADRMIKELKDAEEKEGRV